MAPKGGLFVVIVGCGRLGSHLANRLSGDGHSVVAIDVNDSAFANLSAEYSGFRIEGDAAEYAVLKQSKMDKADMVIAASSDDNVNLMVAQIAKKLFHVPRVIARVLDPKKEAVSQDHGIETVCPTSVAGEALLQSLDKAPAPPQKESREA